MIFVLDEIIMQTEEFILFPKRLFIGKKKERNYENQSYSVITNSTKQAKNEDKAGKADKVV